MIRTTVIGGVIFLIPVVFLLYILAQAFAISSKFAAALSSYLPLESIGGIALVNILAVLLIVLVCFCAGLAAQRPFFTRHVERIENILIEFFPGFTIAKSMATGVTGHKNDLLKTVVVAFDDHEAIAFEIERTESRVIIFLPGAPGAWSGSTVAVPLDRVTPLDLPTHQVTGLLRNLGRGSVAAIQKAGLDQQ